MELAIEPLKCLGCRICEYACNLHQEDDLSALSASLMLHRIEKRNYFGMMIKREQNLLLGRPEGLELVAPGEQVEGAGASSKPILMRVHCDLCEDEDEPFCIAACPGGCLSIVESS